jgi:hypothetical protein
MAVRRLKQERVEPVERLGSYLAALRVADQATEPSEVLAVLASEADGRPAVREWINEFRSQLQAMPGDIHKNLRDMIAIIDAE